MEKFPRRQDLPSAGGRPPLNDASRKRIGELLIGEGLITLAQLNEALAAQQERGGKIVENLIALGHLDAASFTRFIARQPGVGSIGLSNYEIPRDIISLIPKSFAVQHEVVPIDKLGRLLTLGMVCPLDAATIRQLEEKTGLRVKPLLCSPEDVRRAIDRYYSSGKDEEEDGGAHAAGTARTAARPSAAAGTPDASKLPGIAADVVQQARGLESSIKLARVAKLIRQLDTLPALPETVQRAREAMSDPNSSVSDVTDIIKLDPPVAAKILGVANSAAYGFPHRIEDLTLAVSLLGLRETYSILLSVAVVDLFHVSKLFDYRAFWLDAMCCAAASRFVAKAASKRERAGVFAAGLLHRVGQVALAEVAPDAYAQVGRNLVGADLIEAEERVIGIGHPEAGFELANHWGLPAEIAEPIRFYHRPGLAKEAAECVAIVALGEVMTRAVGVKHEENTHLFRGFEDALKALRLDEESAEAMLEDFLARRTEAFQDLPIF